MGGRLTHSAPPLARLAFTTPTGRDAFSHTLLGTQLEPECWGCRWGPVHSFNKYLLSTSRVPGPVLGPGGSAEVPAPVGGQTVNPVNKGVSST